MDTTSRAVHPIVAGPHPVIPRTVVSLFTQMPIYLGVATSPESSERVANFCEEGDEKKNSVVPLETLQDINRYRYVNRNEVHTLSTLASTSALVL